MSIPTDPVEVVRAQLKVSLAPYFKGKVMESKLTEAVDKAVVSIQSLIRIDSVKPGNKGATVMTEDAAIRTGDGKFISKPRSL
jgi:hypothetical protein